LNDWSNVASTKQRLKDLINRVVPDRYFLTRVDKAGAGVVVTFDDGPDPQWTQRSMDVLDEYGIKATYFLVQVEVVENAKRLSDLSGQNVRLFRPPWGKIDVRSAGYLILKGLQIVMWSIDSTDYKKSGPADIMAWIHSTGVRAGDIVLFHDDNEHTIAALPDLVEVVRHNGLAFENLRNH
jgi:peptidoglycan/xylan/chitin deacetylase (PgdA/CDA1 family)